MVTIYGIKNCDSVKKAVKFLKAKEVEYTFVDFKSDPVGCDVITPWLQQVEIKKLFNTRGTTYRTLKLKALNLNDQEKLEWLCRENMLIKRPVLDVDGAISVAFDLKHYERIFS